MVKANEWKKPLTPLVKYLATSSGRGVTVVAHGDRAVAALDPAVELLVHDMAIRPGTRIVREVRGTPGIAEGEATRSSAARPATAPVSTARRGGVERDSAEHGEDALYRVGLARLEKATTENRTGIASRFTRYRYGNRCEGFHAFPRWSGPEQSSAAPQRD